MTETEYKFRLKPQWVRNGVFIVSILEKIGRIIMAPHTVPR